MDDSNYRGTHGGCLATTLGSVLHELGHTFDLGHTQTGIMGRGFDYIDRVFVSTTSIEANRNVAIQRKPQHTTIILSRPLSITVTIQKLPITGSRRSRFFSETLKLQPSAFCESSLSTLRRLSVPASPKFNRSFIKSIANNKETILQVDKTYWGSSCATLLAYHRWFNSDIDNMNNCNFNELKYDIKRLIFNVFY
jgi:hypothetical protein